jgi:hypothetical protein
MKEILDQETQDYFNKIDELAGMGLKRYGREYLTSNEHFNLIKMKARYYQLRSKVTLELTREEFEKLNIQ